MNAIRPNKNLGQHWLHDRASLEAMCDAIKVGTDDIVLEIGPGLGTLTELLVQRAKRVVAVEFDARLARELPKRIPTDNLKVVQADILRYDLAQLSTGYKVAANVPYYITSSIVQHLLTSPNPPEVSALLVQKEVAQRLAAQPGAMSVLAVSAQLFAEVSLGDEVPAYLFTPPPQVDSQIVVFKKRASPLFPGLDEAAFFKVVKAGFSAKRKKLRSSLSGGLGIDKQKAEVLLRTADISPDVRAETVSLDDWARLTRVFQHASI